MLIQTSFNASASFACRRALRYLGAALLGILGAGSRPTLADNVDGAWSPLEDWPLIAVHAALTPDGRVLSYGTNGDGTQTGFFIYDVWDPSAGLDGGHLTLSNLTLTDIFCSSQVILPQSGDILIAGGDNWTGTQTTNTGNNNSNVFDPDANSLTRASNMRRSRWYSSSTVLVNGEVYIQGGSGGGDRPEVRSVAGTFRLLSDAPTGGYAALYPRNFLAPDGRVFGYDTNGSMYFVATAGTGAIASAGQFSSTYAGWTSSAAMYRPGRILQMGGNSNGAVVIDINGPVPTVTPTASMSSRRQWVSATVLADGRVLATGGSSVENALIGVNNSAEIWDPDTGLWHVGAEGAVARLYHSSALLLPDATVLVAGGGAPGPLTNTNAEIYYPPYLFDSSGGFAVRPQIVSAPDTANVGDTLALEVDTSDVSRIALVKTGSVTHSVNMDQRFLDLPFEAAGNVLHASLPARASVTPPGFYMLFAIDDAGVPSEAKMLRIEVDPTPDTSVDYTPMIGGGGGSPFQLSCPVDETLVGIHGRYATFVNQVGPQCVKVDQFGHWIGDPVNGPLAGATTSGTAYAKTCPRDHAVSGFRGRSDDYVDQIDISCRALTPSGGLTGASQFLGPVGGSGGNAQGPLSCGTGNPVYALYGRSGGWLDAFGVLCRPAAITPISVNATPVIVNPGPQSGAVGEEVDLVIGASDSDGDELEFGASGLPPGLGIDSATGRISGSPTAAGIYDSIVSVTDGQATDFAAFTWDIAEAPPLSVDPMPAQAPQLVDTAVSYTASVSGGLDVQYKWNFGDGTPETSYSSSPAVTHVFTSPGIFFVTLTVTDSLGVPAVQSFVQTVHLPLTPSSPRSSANIAYQTGPAGPRVWNVNQDNDSVSIIDAATNQRLAEIAVGSAPRSVAIAPDGRVWVANKLGGSISIVNPAFLSVVQTITLPFGSQPFGIVFSPVANEVFVALEAAGMLLKLDAVSGAQLGSVATGPNPRHVAIDGAGTTVYVSRFITPPQPGEATAVVESEVGGVKSGGEVLVVDAASLTVLQTIVLQHSHEPDAENQGRGVPNYLGAVAISPDGTRAMVPSKQDNIARGTLRSGANLNFQNTVRAIASQIDVSANAEDYARRIDFDNSSVASAALFDPFGIYAFVALETSREVAVVDAHAGAELFRFDVGLAPQGLAMSADGTRLYVNNFMDRSVGVFDLGDLRTTGQWNVPAIAAVESIGTERLDPDVLLGKQLFYDARDTRLARDRYLSCATCHNDGGQDGRVWDLTGMGEGLRNTISLRGTGAEHGFSHWSQNFDEIQDFEGQIRELSGGTGLMSDTDFNAGTRSQPLGDPKAGLSVDLDALAAYVASLAAHPSSPYRNADRSLTAEAVAGREIFVREDCAACHRGVKFTDSDDGVLHDVGTLKPTSGGRLGEVLSGIDTPTLRGAWQSAPYLHDGSALLLGDAVAAHEGVSLDNNDMSLLVEYLKQIDGNEPIAPSAGTEIPPGLVAAYGFDEGAGALVADQSGNGNSGVIDGATWAAGRYGSALSFDGVDDRVRVEGSSSLDLVGSMTLEAWVRPATAQRRSRTIVQRAPASYLLHASTSSSPFALRPAGGGRFAGDSYATITTSPMSLTVGEWTHVALTYDGAALVLYLNGVAVSSVAKSAALAATADPLWIGGNSPYGEYFEGLIDEVRIYNRALNQAEIQADMATPLGPPPPPDTEAPTLTIESPTAEPTYATNEPSIDLAGTATDNDVVAEVNWINSAGGAGVASGTEVWTIDAIPLQPGSNVITVTAVDAAGNTSSKVLDATYTPPPDTEAPVVTISVPTSSPAYDTSEEHLDLGGTASDGVGVVHVSWTNSAGGSGDASGTAAWSVAGLTLQPGSNVITVTAFDDAGNSGADTLTVTYTPPPPPDTEPPVIEIHAPTGAPTWETSSPLIDLAGTASDNVAVVEVTWANSAGGAGVATGTEAWSVAEIALQPGENEITLSARDDAGNSSTATLSVTYSPPPDTGPPAVTITSPTSGASYETSSRFLDVGGTATDNVGVVQVTWANGADGGDAMGTATWTIAGIELQAGTNSIAVTALDAAGNTHTATLEVVYTPPVGGGLVAAYGFDEGAGALVADQSGNGNSGVIDGATWAAGRYGSALSFDGVDDRVRVEGSSSLDLVGSMTLEAWVRPATAQRRSRTIVQRAPASYLLHASTSSSPFALRPAGGGRFAGDSYATITTSPMSLTVGEWTHVALTYDGAALVLYLNGVAVSSVAKSAALAATADPLWIGGNSPYGEYFEGLIDEVRIYNRALNQAEIQADMATPLGP